MEEPERTSSAQNVLLLDQLQIGRAIYDFQASNPDELSLAQGDRFRVVEMFDDGWWLVQHDERGGIVPSTYVELVPTEPADEKYKNISEDIDLTELMVVSKVVSDIDITQESKGLSTERSQPTKKFDSSMNSAKTLVTTPPTKNKPLSSPLLSPDLSVNVKEYDEPELQRFRTIREEAAAEINKIS